MGLLLRLRDVQETVAPMDTAFSDRLLSFDLQQNRINKTAHCTVRQTERNAETIEYSTKRPADGAVIGPLAAQRFQSKRGQTRYIRKASANRAQTRDFGALAMKPVAGTES
jgi:hypothetical protein